jgi:hypothetical protein
MTEFDSHKFYSLKHNHQDIDMLLDKIAKGWVLSEKDYKKLIVDIGLNNISTFTGDYEALFNKPNLAQMINDALVKINIPEESTIDEKISIVKNEILQQVNKAMEDKANVEHNHSISNIDALESVLNTKANKEHDHDDAYYNKAIMDQKLQEVQDNAFNGAGYATVEDLSRVHDLLTAKAEKNHTHNLNEIPDIQLELNKKADKSLLDNMYNKVDVYNKSEIDDLLKNSSDSNHTHDEFYTKEETDATFVKVDEFLEVLDDYATKEDLNNKESIINGKLNSKADKDHVHNNIYTKEEIDDMIIRAGSGGNIDLAGYIKQSQLDEAMSTKADKEHFHNEYSEKDHVHNYGIDDISGLREALENKADGGVEIPENILELIENKSDKDHTHVEYALGTHGHSIANIAGLQEVLDTIPNKEDLLNQNHLNELQSAIQQKADKEHEHNQYANAVHTHEQYSEIGHAHDEYAKDEHTHDEYSKTDHSHSEYAQREHEHIEIERIQESLQEKVDKNFVYTKEEIDDKLVELGTGGGSIDLGGYVKQSELYNALLEKSDVGHIHDEYAGKEHKHNYDEIEELQSVLDNKANVKDVPSNGDLSIALASKSDLGHIHEINEINELQAQLDKKINRDELDLSIAGKLSDIEEALAGKAEIVHSHDEYALAEHNHNELYYSKEEVDAKLAENGSSNEMLLQANAYTDTAVSKLTQDAPENLNTFSKVSVVIQEERSKVETMIAGKADSNHAHTEYATVEQENARDIFETTELTVNTVGGINAGTNLNGLTVKEILTKLLFPYVAPTVSAQGTPNGGTFEKGDNQTISNVKIVVTKKSEKITKIQLYKGSTLLETLEGADIENGGTFNIPVSVPVNSTNVTLTAKVTDTTGTVKQATTGSFTFVYPYYVGVCGENDTINASLIKGLEKKVESKATKTISYTTNNQRMILAYPKSYGKIVKILDPNSFDVTSTFEVKEVTVPCLDGSNQSYYVYINGASSVEDFIMKFSY